MKNLIVTTIAACALALGTIGATSALVPESAGISQSQATWQHYWGVTVPDRQCNTVNLVDALFSAGLIPGPYVDLADSGGIGGTRIYNTYFVPLGSGPNGCSNTAIQTACKTIPPHARPGYCEGSTAH